MVASLLCFAIEASSILRASSTAKAIFAEFEEWIEPNDGDLEIMSLEPFDDQS